ncbi:LysR family transcriptional regulator [Agromyces mediolanus]|uniref:LysR family transcriptional regulator n=1 Tax=Agromyces mediolanus TaxID=41986 RepID=UPI00203C396B|nr:LysR family transcriptional regulator [Agromyces mediolanus]MCM3658568.1 LysR family transcriptional regulator [Agromyces mediolanus]
MLDLRQLRALLAVDEHGSLAQAARALDWSQPTVSHHLAALGRVSGAPVIASDASGTRLTEAGRSWLPHAVAIVERADRALAEVRDAVETGRRTVRFGVFPTAAARLLPQLVRALDGRGWRVEAFEAELDVVEAALARLALDAAVVYATPGETPHAMPGLTRTRLFTERFSLVLPAGHPLTEGGPVPLRALADTPWIIGTKDDDPVDAAFRAAARRAGFEPEIGPRSDDYRVVVEYVAAGLGVALVPELALPVWRDDLVLAAPAGLRLSREVSLVTAATMDPALREELSAALGAGAA